MYNSENHLRAVTTSPFSVRFHSSLRPPPDVPDDRLLAVIGFGNRTHTDVGTVPRVTVGLRQVGSEVSTELWYSNTPVTYGHDGRFAYSRSAQVLFAHLLLDEAPFSDIDEAIHLFAAGGLASGALIAYSAARLFGPLSSSCLPVGGNRSGQKVGYGSENLLSFHAVDYTRVQDCALGVVDRGRRRVWASLCRECAKLLSHVS